MPLLVAMSLLGCKHAGSAKLEGRWRGIRVDGVTADLQAQADAFASGTELEVKGDDISVLTPASKLKQSGKYKVVKEDKGTVILFTEGDGQNDAQTFTFVDDRTVKWTVVEGKTITLRKL
jgi:hypothetical protein